MKVQRKDGLVAVELSDVEFRSLVVFLNETLQGPLQIDEEEWSSYIQVDKAILDGILEGLDSIPDENR